MNKVTGLVTEPRLELGHMTPNPATVILSLLHFLTSGKKSKLG